MTRADAIPEEKAAERRRHPRRQVDLAVLCSTGREEGAGQLVNVSLSGALIDPASIRPRLGAPVGLRLETRTGAVVEIPCTVVRHSPRGFAVSFSERNPVLRSLVEHGEIEP